MNIIKQKRSATFLLFSIIFILASSCSGLNNQETPIITPSLTLIPTATQIPSPTPTQKLPEYYVSFNLPDVFAQSIHAPADWIPTDQIETADVRFEVGDENPVSTWIYALVAPFPTIIDEISSEELLSIWQLGESSISNIHHIYTDQNTLNVLQTQWGSPSMMIEVQPCEQIKQMAWHELNSWAIIPFEQLDPQWKVIQIDGFSPIHKDFDSTTYFLSVTLSANGENANAENLRSIIANDATQSIITVSNRDEKRLTTVILTGVTALVRATAAMMEYRGMTYPGEDIRQWLLEADFTHINNEVPFSENCPTPQGEQESLVFCSKPQYIELLRDIGTDIVDLSGDHFADWGDDAILYTLDLYKQENWKTFGGGINLEEGLKPLLIEHNGNKLAFLGCNAKSPGYAQASKSRPGAAHCDFDYMHKEINRLRTEGYLPIITLQHIEYYSYTPNPLVIPDFKALADAGAVIVSGNQSHQPQAIEFYQDSFLHYGLGNLFFDQYYEGLPTRQAFIDRHVFYNNKHISSELLTIMFIDLARSRPMTPEERSDVLTTVFNASGWKITMEE